MQFQFTRHLQSITSANFFYPPYPSLRKGYLPTNTQLSLQQHKTRLQALNMCFLLQVTSSTAVYMQFYSVHATDTHENAEADISAVTSESQVLWQSALPYGSHCDKDRLEGENNCKIPDNG